jgi:hypothetical protein
MIDLTTIPLTSEILILNRDLTINIMFRNIKSSIIYDFSDGITIFINCIILYKNTESTFPLPFFICSFATLRLLPAIRFFK